jgi:hypothetical protein
MRTLLTICAALVFVAAAPAAVSPPAPTTNDVISYGVFIQMACPTQRSVHIDGFHIDIAVVVLPALCPAVGAIVNVPLGPLRGGTYTVTGSVTMSGVTTTFTDTFVVTAAEPIPALDRGALLALVIALAALGVFAVRR